MPADLYVEMKASVVVLLIVLLALAPIVAYASTDPLLTVHMAGEDGRPLSGVTVYVVNGTSRLGSAATDSEGYAKFNITSQGLMLVVSGGPVAWRAVNLSENISVHLWLNSTDLRKVNITVKMGDVGGKISFNATFSGLADNVQVEGTVSDMKAPVFVYVSPNDVMKMSIPSSVRANFVTYTLANVTVTKANGEKVFTNATQIEVNSTVVSVEIQYKTATPLFLNLPLQTWIAIGMTAVLASILAVIVRTKKAAAALLERRKRRTIREYEIAEGFNGFLESIETADNGEKRRLARRMLKRVS